jgi:predicted dehydrogenase
MKIGVVGAGWWGKNIINTLENVERVSNVFVYDPIQSSYEKFINNKKTIFLKSFKEMIEDNSISSICIATPPHTHYELTKEALLSNKNILVEKPPASKISQLDELGNIASKNSLVYMLDAIYLFLAPVMELKNILDSISFADIKYIEMYRIGDELRRENAGLERIQNTMFNNNTDVIQDLLFHDVGILLYLFKNIEIKSVEKLYLYNEKLCDTAVLRFMHNSIPVNLTLSWSLTGRRRGLTIYHKDFIIEYDGLKQENQIIQHTLKKNSSKYSSFQNEPPLKALLEFYIDCINNKKNNHLDYNFMKKITDIWEYTQNGR